MRSPDAGLPGSHGHWSAGDGWGRGRKRACVAGAGALPSEAARREFRRSVSGARDPIASCRVPLNGLRSPRGEHIREMVKQINDIRHHVTF